VTDACECGNEPSGSVKLSCLGVFTFSTGCKILYCLGCFVARFKLPFM